ncbi:MAG TPA: hypothetical protein VGN93_06260 [Shinella sp.]|uniref:hypothetical protein n=1 Tax=Shinella sp. TaxID=1870904 RepID=UPI002E0D61DB|nr:hypothetical protein [Shinella sp.]
MTPERKFKSSLDLVASLDALLMAAGLGLDVEDSVEEAVCALQGLPVNDMEDALATLAFSERFRRRALECAASGEPVDPVLLIAAGDSLAKAMAFLEKIAGLECSPVRVH